MTREITGRQVFAVTAGAFAIIIGVNITLAVNAVKTFPGLEVANSYVASQSFDADRAAQEALGWTMDLRHEGHELLLAVTGPGGEVVEPAQLDATLGRATHVADDMTPAFVFDGRQFRAPADLGNGYWELRLEAEAADGTLFRQRLELFVSPRT